MPLKRFAIIFFLILILASTLRLPRLAQRPMHTDEAVHAVKFNDLLENHHYVYDPFEYHGPVLNYISLIPAWLKKSHSILTITEFDLRIIPVFFGIALIALLWFMRNPLGKQITLLGAFFLAISPAFVFFSRYYIMEIILIFFNFSTIVFIYWYVKKNRIVYAILAGASIGLMHATKETCIIAWFAIFVACVLTCLTTKRKFSIPWLALIAALLAAAFTSALFFSSFGKNIPGVLASVQTYLVYFQRGVGGFQNHVYPWYYYFKWLWQAGDWPLLVFAVIGIGFALIRKTIERFDLMRAFAFYTIIMIFVYSFISYKTPWSMLGFLFGVIVLAAYGSVQLYRYLAKWRWVSVVLVICGSAVLLYSTIQLNYFYYADEAKNPYVYGHTHLEIYKLVDAVRQLSEASAQKNAIYIEVVAPNDDYWPLPWYLRDYPHVGYCHAVNFDLPAAPLIIASPDVENDVLRKLYEIPPAGKRNMYLPFFDHGVQLRALVELDLYVEKSLYDEWWRLQP